MPHLGQRGDGLTARASLCSRNARPEKGLVRRPQSGLPWLRDLRKCVTAAPFCQPGSVKEVKHEQMVVRCRRVRRTVRPRTIRMCSIWVKSALGAFGWAGEDVAHSRDCPLLDSVEIQWSLSKRVQKVRIAASLSYHDIAHDFTLLPKWRQWFPIQFTTDVASICN